MKLGIMLGGTPVANASVEDYVATARDLEARGFDSLWLAHIRRHDAVMAMALAGRETRRIEVGTAVTPIQPRHPMALAQQALTAQAMARGRFTLGVGLSHKRVIEDMLGLSYAQPAKSMREYLEVLTPLLQGESVDFSGELYRTAIDLEVTDATLPVSVVVAALGPLMLRVAGTFSDGTLLWMTGPRTIESHIRPGIEQAAAQAGRPAPRIIAPFPVVLTNDEAGARAEVGRQLVVYGQLPSYRAMLDREGVDGPAELALVGDEKALTAALGRLAEAGVTDFAAALVDVGDGSAERTLEFMQGQL